MRSSRNCSSTLETKLWYVIAGYYMVICFSDLQFLIIGHTGDIGSAPDQVEKTLAHFFSLAEAWGCILLLDEADEFLTHRRVGQLNRNAVVSGE